VYYVSSTVISYVVHSLITSAPTQRLRYHLLISYSLTSMTSVCLSIRLLPNVTAPCTCRVGLCVFLWKTSSYSYQIQQPTHQRPSVPSVMSKMKVRVRKNSDFYHATRMHSTIVSLQSNQLPLRSRACGSSKDHFKQTHRRRSLVAAVTNVTTHPSTATVPTAHSSTVRVPNANRMLCKRDLLSCSVSVCLSHS